MPSKKYTVFLSHNSLDKPEVEAVAKHLGKDGEIEVWLDKWNLLPGDEWIEQIEGAFEQCNVFLFFVGKNGSGPWQHEEMTLAIDKRVTPGKSSFRVIPVLLPGAERGDRSKLSRFLVRSTWVEFRKSVGEEDTLAWLVNGIKGKRPTVIKGDSSICPFKGLEFFDLDDHKHFYGREALTEWLLNDLKESRENRFLAIVGASGSGKSSLARAGLLATLKQGKLLNGDKWPQVVLFPGQNPLENLAVGLASREILSSNPTDTLAFIRSALADERSLHILAKTHIAKYPDLEKVVIFVDQFEEVFTQCKDEATRRSFIDNLCYVATAPEGKAVVLLTMRSDFFGKCAPYESLSALVSNWSLLVGPMNEDEVREAIRMPAILNGFEYDEGLVDKLVEETTDEPGSLPLLQDTLRELWEKKKGNQIKYSDYLELGGLAGGLDKRATAFYKNLPEKEKALCKTIFLRLTQPGEGTEDTKRRVAMTELTSIPDAGPGIDQLLKHLSGSEHRLLSVSKDYVEISHEALIRNWDMMRSWIEEERENLIIHRRLTRDAEDWFKAGQDSDFLYTGSRLAQIEEWAGEKGGFLNEEENRFMRESMAAREARDKNARRVRISIFAALVAFIGILSFSLIQANMARKRADVNKGSALSALAINELGNIDPWIVYRLAEEAYFLNPNDFQIRNNFFEAVRHFRPNLAFRGLEISDNHKNAIINKLLAESGSFNLNAAAFSHDESLVLTYKFDSIARVWTFEDLENPIILKGHTSFIHGAVFNHNDTKVLTYSFDNTVRVWTLTEPNTPIILKGHSDFIKGAVFSHDDTKVLTYCADSTARIWFLSNPKTPILLKGHSDKINGAVFNKNGSHALTYSDDGTARIWSLSDPQNPIILKGDPGGIEGAVFNRDESKVLVYGAQGIALVFPLTDLDNPTLLKGHSNAIIGAVFNRICSHALTYSLDGTARIWSLSNPQNPIILKGDREGIAGAVFNQEEDKVLTYGLDGMAQVFSLTDLDNPIILKGHTNGIMTAIFSPDESQVVTFSIDGTARIWTLSDPENSVVLKTGGPGFIFGGFNTVHGWNFSYSKNYLATLNLDGTTRIWFLAEMVKPVVLKGPQGSIKGAFFSEDERRVLAYGEDSTARIWTLGDLENPIILKGHSDEINGALFNGNGSHVLTYSADGTACIWALSDPESPIVLKGNLKSVKGAVFTRDEKRVLTYGFYGAEIWILSDPGSPIFLGGHKGQISGASFTNDERRVLTYGADSTARIWTLSDPGNPIILRGHQGSIKGAFFSNDERRVLAYGADSTARIWTLSDLENPIILKGHSDEINGAMFNRNGSKVLTYSADGTARIWALSNPENPLVLYGHTGEVEAAVFTRDEKQVLTIGEDWTARVWTILDHENPIVLDPGTDFWEFNIFGNNYTPKAKFNQKENWIITYGWDRTARIWSISEPKSPIELKGHLKKINGAIFTHDESRVLTYSADGTVRIWDLNIDRIVQNLYDKYPVMMRQELDETVKRKYGLEGLYLKKFGRNY